MNTSPINSIYARSQATATTTASGTAGKNANDGLSSDFETFLRMLTVQLQNQDPLNPVDASDYAVQLATFSGVEQQVKTNELLGQLGTRFDLFGLGQFADWIGKDALHDGPVYFDGSPVDFQAQLPDDTDAARLVVRTVTGTEVMTGILPDNSGKYTWDGIDSDGSPLPFGQYVLTIEPSVQGIAQETISAQSYAPISQAKFDNGSVVLTLDNLGDVNPADIFGLRSQ